jgi:predicted nucleic acid-binding protein
MRQRVFVDSDVILDFALTREPFFEQSKKMLAFIQNKWALGFSSSNIIANVHYVLRKAKNDADARGFLSDLLTFIRVLPPTHRIVRDALVSDFGEFEDAMQYYTALKKRCHCIITRNVRHYQKSQIQVLTPTEFLQSEP